MIYSTNSVINLSINHTLKSYFVTILTISVPQYELNSLGLTMFCIIYGLFLIIMYFIEAYYTSTLLMRCGYGNPRDEPHTYTLFKAQSRSGALSQHYRFFLRILPEI